MFKYVTGILLVGVAVLATGCVAPGESAAEKRTNLTNMHDKTLADLYDKYPEAQDQIKSAVGHAVFHNSGGGTLLGGAGGWGVAMDANNQPTYMQMGMFSFGLGIAIKDWRGVLIFTDPQAYSRFLQSEWKSGGEAEAAFNFGETGGQACAAGYFGEGVRVYQLTENGVVLRASVPVASYWRYKELN